jgi:hypothetical protein
MLFFFSDLVEEAKFNNHSAHTLYMKKEFHDRSALGYNFILTPLATSILPMWIVCT